MADLSQIALILGISLPLLIAMAIWSLVWKGLALWRAGRKNSPIWFVILLIVNTLGILEILYLFIFSKLNEPISQKKEIVKKIKRRR